MGWTWPLEELRMLHKGLQAWAFLSVAADYLGKLMHIPGHLTHPHRGMLGRSRWGQTAVRILRVTVAVTPVAFVNCTGVGTRQQGANQTSRIKGRSRR